MNGPRQQATFRVAAIATIGGAMGFISDDVDEAREEQASRMRFARATIAETSRILAGAPRPLRPHTAKAARRQLSPAEQKMDRCLDDLLLKTSRITSDLAADKVLRAIENVRRALNSSRPPLPIYKER